jgi:deoxyribodipyrimidine photo-lyase
MHQTVIHWFRRDLRLTDNTALMAAAAGAAQVVPVYILSDWQKKHGWTGSARQQFLCGCLDSLAKNLVAGGSRLIFRKGSADVELERLVKETGAGAIYFNRGYDPFGRDMEKKVREMCARLGIECHDHKDIVMQEPHEVLTGEGLPYRVYTPYWKNWSTQQRIAPVKGVVNLKPKAGEKCKTSLADLKSLPVPTLDFWKLPPCTAEIPAPGERAARDRMKAFIEQGVLERYAANRDTLSGRTTSGISQDLRYGLVSIRELTARCADHEKYVKELAWREFYMAILFHYPEVFEVEFNPEFRGMPWPGTEEDFQRWSEARTGFPLVDAGMRQLLQTGLMHNRVRMIVSMFLTKDLHCDWRMGESFFMQHLVDGENASNNGGWQWSAGTGADAAPYFRIQNPWTQSKRHDPEAKYIKQWLPELAHLPPEKLMDPPDDGKPIAPGYPLPMVDHAKERDRCLARFAKHKESRR